MNPDKLYLPTSSLNFNNIMSSESISPKSFFVHRKFGYDRFYNVQANNLDNYILLYEKYPFFYVDDSKLENYPIVFEIYTRNLNIEIQECQGVYLTHQTIYLNPFNTKVIFRNPEERQNTIGKTFPMIDTKLISLYQGQFVVLTSDIETFNWNRINVNDLPNYDNNAVSYDIILNKLKGMLYGYLLGANESSSNEVVSLKRMIKELRNVLSAILSSPDGKCTHFQQQQLDELYTNINQTFYKLGGVESKIKEVISQKMEIYNTPSFEEILKREGLYQEWFRKQTSLLNLRYNQITPFHFPCKAINKVLELDNYIDDIEQKIFFYDNKTKLDVSKLPIIQNRHIVEVPEQNDFLSILLNGYIDEVWNGTEFLSSRYEFAKVGGKLFKESSGDKWENSPARTYINSLLKNLNEYTEFDINNTESDILKSFAAFCQKGEGDIDKLRDYLISNGIGDFRIAFALWGLIFGFAEMPKTLTDDFYNNADRQYVSEVYKYIYKQVHGVDLEGELGVKEIINEEIKQEYSVKERRNTTITISSRINDMTEESDNTIPQSENKTPDTKERISKPMPEFLKKIQDTHYFKNMSAEAQKYYTEEALKIYEGKEDKTFFGKLEKLSYKKTGTQWKKIIQLLRPKKKNGIDKNNTSQTSIDFRSESTGNFLEDLDFLLYNEEFKSLVSNIKRLENDLKWFIDAHDPNSEDYNYYEDKPTDNESVINQFLRLKTGKYKNTESFLRKTYLK